MKKFPIYLFKALLCGFWAMSSIAMDYDDAQLHPKKQIIAEYRLKQAYADALVQLRMNFLVGYALLEDLARQGYKPALEKHKELLRILHKDMYARKAKVKKASKKDSFKGKKKAAEGRKRSGASQVVKVGVAYGAAPGGEAYQWEMKHSVALEDAAMHIEFIRDGSLYVYCGGFYIRINPITSTQEKRVADIECKINHLTEIRDQAVSLTGEFRAVIEDGGKRVDIYQNSESSAGSAVASDDDSESFFSDTQENSADELFRTAQKFEEQRQYKKAFEYFNRAAEKGHASALNQVGVYYEYPKLEGMKQDNEIAAWYYADAIKAGCADANFNLARLYDFGEGVTKNKVKAAYYYRKAAAAGISEAYVAFGALEAEAGGAGQAEKMAEDK